MTYAVPDTVTDGGGLSSGSPGASTGTARTPSGTAQPRRPVEVSTSAMAASERMADARAAGSDGSSGT